MGPAYFVNAGEVRAATPLRKSLDKTSNRADMLRSRGKNRIHHPEKEAKEQQEDTGTMGRKHVAPRSVPGGR